MVIAIAKLKQSLILFVVSLSISSSDVHIPLSLRLPFVHPKEDFELVNFDAFSIRHTKVETNSSIDLLLVDGFKFISYQEKVKLILNDISLACNLQLNNGDASIKEGHGCIHSYLQSHPLEVNELIQLIITSISINNEKDEISKTTSCSNKVLVFARLGSSPQNMHFDEVYLGSNNETRFRVWMPLVNINDAPLVISNTTYLYKDMNINKLSLNIDTSTIINSNTMDSSFLLENKNLNIHQSAGSKIYGIDQYLKDCEKADIFTHHDERRRRNHIDNSKTCSLYHTLGMIPGEMLAFQNSIIFHGSASLLNHTLNHSNGRYALAFDCLRSH